MADSLEMLRSRRREIAAEVQNLRAKLEAIEAEDAELATAESILARFGVLPPEEPSFVQGSFATGASIGSGKPANVPTTPNMIIGLLREAQAHGKPGLEPKEMQISISKRWWPSVKSEDVGPTAWRMWKDGRLAKDGSLYMLPKNTEAAADLLGVTAASE